MILGILKAVILGIVEGVTEFLPVSSTGHLILVNQWLNFSSDFTKMFDIVIQLGAILSVLVYFWPRLWPFSADKEKNQNIWNLWFKTALGVLPALVVGAFLGDLIEEKLFSPAVVAGALVIGGLALILIEVKKRQVRIKSINDLPYRIALAIGFFQVLAMIPGTSRSAATIIGVMLLGASRVVAAEFSFFLAIPTMVAASGYSFLKHSSAMTSQEMLILSVGFIVSFLTALIVIKLFMNYISRHDFKIFGYYRVGLGIIVILYFILR